MSFNPDAYGNPTLKKRDNSANKGESRLDRHPGWGITQHPPASHWSSGMPWHSAQGEGRTQDRGEEQMVEEEQGEEVTSLDVQPTEPQNVTTDGKVKGSNPTWFLSQDTVATVDSSVREFDKTAYGDPSRKKMTKTTTHPPKQRQSKLNSANPPAGRRNGWPEVGTASTAEPQSSPPLAHRPLPMSHVTLDASRNPPEPTDYNTPQPKMNGGQESRLKTTSSRNDPTKSVTPRPETFETLKQGDETPEQLIARLQAEGTRDVFQRVKRKDQGEIPTTTGLALLDLLRKPLPPASDEPQPDASTTETQRKPLSNIDPSSSWNQSSQEPIRPTNHLLTEMKQANKDQRHWEHDMKNPALWEQAALPRGNDTSSIQLQEPGPSRNTTDLQKTTGLWNQSAVPSVSDGATWNEGGARPGNEVAVPLLHQSGQGNEHSWALRQKSDKAARRNSRWASAADMKAPKAKTDSNAAGSEEAESDGDSTRPMARGLGRLIRSRKPPVPEERLVGWDGQFLPPPTDWEYRPRFYNNTPDYISGFENWLGEVTVRTMSEKSVAELSFGVLPTEQVENLDNHPDGIGFAPRETVLGPINSERYGHRLIKPIMPDPQNPTDFDGDAKLDLSDPDNARYKDETAQLYIARRMAQIKHVQMEAEEKARLQQEAERQEQFELGMGAKAQEDDAAVFGESSKPLPPPTTKNIYLRPAVQADAPGMMEIINWYITHGFRPPELAPISEDDMIERMRMSQHARLPFIVAVERTRKTSRPKGRKYPRVNPNHPIQNIDPDYLGVTREEPIVGWASATDWSAPDYCECIAADLELYVAASSRKSGVGRCLMDAILDATDRGYMKKGGYEFRVAPEIKHMYSGGGGRDLHKLVFQVRSYNRPFTPEQMERIRRSAMGTPDLPLDRNASRWNRKLHSRGPTPALSADEREPPKKDFSKSARIDDREDDYEIWLKDWLESYCFEEEARLKMMGTKHGRFMDVRYLSRETCWQPSEGRIPDYTHGY
ncbi:hypothetical protein G647_07338 [Cladophialophora carrionii CBS 160.54]|uniref:N-acetyltransferase domain-containing protein n=1 Tax=Cladophialophora carrionii CBS 160.54 TaxID=1279043 RepID=V9D295_9EURO|nr:uncharacterized protein G647_07338 [Cladophialophora carrionii CBS 160.54]ETI20995.1 hypothetical protein G647_07338 [Cladophialophora carrionii CBS 160.54]